MKIDLVAMQVADNRRTLQATVLHRKSGKWNDVEIAKLQERLVTEVSGRDSHPEHLILFGHYTKEVTLKALGGGAAYTATQVTGVENLPFPCFV